MCLIPAIQKWEELQSMEANVSVCSNPKVEISLTKECEWECPNPMMEYPLTAMDV